MKPAPFVYHAPTSLAEALELLSEHGEESKVLAGGQSLVPMLNFRLATPSRLVDINRIEELRRVELADGELRVGACARQRDLESSPEAELSLPLLHEAIINVAHVQIRNRGTVCGSLAHADPAAELPAAMVALDATMIAASVSGCREIPATEFFRHHFTTALELDELLVEVRVRLPPAGTLGRFLELTHRHGDFALVGVAAWVRFGGGGEVLECRIVCSGVAPIPLRVLLAEQAVVAGGVSDPVLLEAQYATIDSVEPTDDAHAPASYRRQVAGVLVRRCLEAVRSDKGALGA